MQIEPSTTVVPALIRREHPRLFLIQYNQSKLRSANPQTRAYFKQERELWGASWPATEHTPAGVVSLCNGVTFGSMTELQGHFDRSGQYTITWLDEV